MQKKHRLEKVHHRRKWLISANIPIIWSAQWAPIALKVCAPYGRPALWGEDLRLTNANECETLDDELTFVWVLGNWLRDSQFSSQDCISEHLTNIQLYESFPFLYKEANKAMFSQQTGDQTNHRTSGSQNISPLIRLRKQNFSAWIDFLHLGGFCK